MIKILLQYNVVFPVSQEETQQLSQKELFHPHSLEYIEGEKKKITNAQVAKFYLKSERLLVFLFGPKWPRVTCIGLKERS